MVFAASALSLIKVFGPRTGTQGRARKFVQALSDEFRTSPAPMHDGAFAALLNNGGDSTVGGDVEAVAPAITPGSKDDKEPRCQSGTSSWKARENSSIVMSFKELGDLLVILFDRWEQSQDGASQADGFESTGTDDGNILA